MSDLGLDDERVADERLALTSLALWSVNPDSDLLECLVERFDFVPMSRVDALRLLADRTVEQIRIVPRLVVLDLLVRLASRRDAAVIPEAAGADADDIGLELDRLIIGLVAEAAGPMLSVPLPLTGDVLEIDPAAHVRTALFEIAEADDIEPWAYFVAHEAEVMRLSPAEINKPICDDSTTVMADGTEAVVLEMQYHSPMSVEQLKPWTDPRNWPACSVGFKAMNPIEGPTPVPPPRLGWNGDFSEVVRFGSSELVTPLRVRYREDPNKQWARCEYKLITPTQDLLVDEGFLWVGHDPSAPAATPTLVKTAKVYLFADPRLQTWQTVCCDTIWMELVIDMATRCGKELGSMSQKQQQKPGTSTLPGSIDAEACRELFDKYGAIVGSAIDRYSDMAKRTHERHMGSDPLEPKACMDDAVAALGGVTTDAMKMWLVWVDHLQSHAATGSPKPSEEGSGTDDTEPKPATGGVHRVPDKPVDQKKGPPSKDPGPRHGIRNV